MLRPRVILLLILLAILPVGLALLIGREGHKRVPLGAGAVPTQISLELKRPTGDTRMVGCGITHHYAVYPAGATIGFRGVVAEPPHARWRVRLKLKSCVAGAFRPAGDSSATQRASDSFRGSFRAPVPGLYFARASVNAGGAPVARSYKRFFVVR